MSTWGTIDAQFYGPYCPGKRLLSENLPTGSERGPDVVDGVGKTRVEGRLRDVEDQRHSPAVLAWFADATKFLRTGECATLLWEIDGGPRYRYEYTKDGMFVKLKGVLDL